jgi:hypothetical protein
VISPDSSWVVYRADQDIDEVYELFGVKIETDACLGDHEPDGDVDGYDIFTQTTGGTGISLAAFAEHFGRDNCP